MDALGVVVNDTRQLPRKTSLYFYPHIAKTGGTSWSADIARIDTSPLTHCGSSHVVGPSSLAILRNNLISGGDDCNLLNREEPLDESLAAFSSLGFVEPKLILLLRHPVTHVRSMYAHCQAGYLRKQRERLGTFRPISFENWLGLYTRENVSTSGWNNGGGVYCYYHPRNFQSAMLAPQEMLAGHGWNDDASRVLSAEALEAVLSLIRRAWFVGVTGYYSSSLCLLEHRLVGRSDCPATLKTTHEDYGNHASTTALTGTELSRILELTQADHVVYGVALSRLFKDTSEAGLAMLGYFDM
jgi:hypothetical protein